MTNVLQLPNVSIRPELAQKGITTESNVVLILREVVAKLAMDKPLWRFVAHDKNYTGAVDHFIVMQDGEELGQLEATYFRGNNCISVSNKRIKQARERSSSYRTKDSNKAIATIKKMFNARSVAERLADASETAGNVMYQLSSNKHREFSHADRDLGIEAVKFVKGEGNEIFVRHLEAVGKHSVVSKYEVLKQEKQVLDAARDAYANDKTALVLLGNGMYVVKKRAGTEIFDDNTLPEALRGKVGMLKLVEDEHFITGIGCRASADVFVLLLDEENENEAK